MFKEIRVKFIDDINKTYVPVYFRLPRTKKKRIVKKWKKKFHYMTPDLKGCNVYKTDIGNRLVYAIAHPKAKIKMQEMNAAGVGTDNPKFVWEWDE